MTNDTDLNPYPTAESIREAAEIDPAFRAGVEAALALIDAPLREWGCREIRCDEPIGEVAYEAGWNRGYVRAQTDLLNLLNGRDAVD